MPGIRPRAAIGDQQLHGGAIGMNKSRTLEQLEAHLWPEPPADSSPRVSRCHALRKLPLEQLSAGDCRVLLTQGIGTRFVLPIALEIVEADPLVEGDYYAGDLLTALLRLSADDFSGDAKAIRRLMAAARRADDLLTSNTELTGSDLRLKKDIRAALDARA